MSFHSRLQVNTECTKQYRHCVADLDIPIEEIDTLIDIVHSILSYFVDQAFHVQTDQITLRSGGNGFNASLGHATIEHHPENPTARVEGYGVEGDSKPLGPTEP
jgi:hypothetical protein